MKKLLLLASMVLSMGTVSGQETSAQDSLGVDVYYRCGYSALENPWQDNGMRLESFANRLLVLQKDSLCRIQQVRIVSGTSPEGTEKVNKQLANNRSECVRSYLSNILPSGNVTYDITSDGEDWEGLKFLVAGSDMPARDEVMTILRNTPVWVIKDGKIVDSRKRQLGMLYGGKPWRYMEEHFFPMLRRSQVTVFYEQILQQPTDTITSVSEIVSESNNEIPAMSVADDTSARQENVEDSTSVERKPFYMALKTNMLYDAVLIPNIGGEFYIGRGWSVEGNWMYAWWNSDKHHNYWRIYGGELGVRKYFGSEAHEKPLSGHHLGVYGMMLTYDFELGSKGYMGGKPGGTLWDKMNWGVGIEYGYSIPVSRHFNIDFGIGVGYLGGEYREYTPIDNHYVWTATKRRHWFGPTKAEISLVWLIGRGNNNIMKGDK